MKKSLFTICVLVLLLANSALAHVFQTSTVQRSEDEECVHILVRVTGRETRYLGACECTKNGIRATRARVFTKDLATEKPTLAKDRATLRCLFNRRARLSRACKVSGGRYNKIGKRALNTCRKASPKKGDKTLIPNPNKLKLDKCGLVFVNTTTSTETGPATVCACKNRFFYTALARAQFFTNLSPTDPRTEVFDLQSCVTKAQRRLLQVCQNNPGDFELLALQLYEVCCKRARKAFDAKFQCKAAVPDDISFLKSFLGN